MFGFFFFMPGLGFGFGGITQCSGVLKFGFLFGKYFSKSPTMIKFRDIFGGQVQHYSSVSRFKVRRYCGFIKYNYKFREDLKFDF